jgi:hypothetical protein
LDAEEIAMFDVFRFAWFAVRTFLGLIVLAVALYAALWLFVKLLQADPGSDDPGAALQRVNSYNAQAAGRDRAAPAIPLDHTSPCSESRGAGCSRR